MSYASEVLADAPLIYWRLGESSGTVAADTSGNGNDGTYTNGPTLGTTGLLVGDSNTAATFDGVDDSVQSVATFSSLLTAVTAEAMMKPAVISNNPSLYGFADDILEVTITSDGRVLAQAGAASFQSAAATIAVGETYHVVVTSDGATGTIYVNGVSAATGSAVPFTPSGVGFWAGNDAADDPFGGVIDEVAFYESALSAARVLAHYNASVGPGLTYTPPIAYDMGPIIPDTQGLQRLLFRHYSPHGRFQTVWKLATDPITYSLTQPYPLITPEDVNQGNTPIGQQYMDATYLHVYYGPELVDADEAARLVASGIGTVT